MADLNHVEIAEIDAIDGFFEGIKLYKAAAGLGVSSFGISIIDLAPGADEYPEHDHSEDGLGGQMFASGRSSWDRRRSTWPYAALER